MTQHAQKYDSSLKSLLEGQTTEVVSHLLPGVEVEDELNGEILKPPLRADRVYRIRFCDKAHILHIELETSTSTGIPYRLLEYCSMLLKKYRLPVMSVVIYPFCTSVPSSPLEMFVGSELALSFHYSIIALWTLNARDFVDKHAIGVYALLPTMQGADFILLSQALDEMKKWHVEGRMLAEQILLFDTFLQRTEMVSAEDKLKIQEKLQMFDSLLEESRFAKKKAAEAAMEVEAAKKEAAEAAAEARVEVLRQVVVEIVGARFPELASLAEQTVGELYEPAALHFLVKKISAAPDENLARWLLDAA